MFYSLNFDVLTSICARCDIATLLPLCLVSKVTRAAATPFLYRRLQLTTGNYAKVLAALELNPTLPTFVRALIVPATVWQTLDDWQRKAAVARLISAMITMKRLQELEFDTIHVLDGVVSAIVHLPELHTVRIRPHTRFLGDLLSILPPLEMVELIMDTDTFESEGFFDLTSFAALLGSLLERSVTTLRDISLSSATWRALALHYRKSTLGSWSRVERLALIDGGAQVTAFAARTFPSVRVLTGTFSIVPTLKRWNAWPQLSVLTLVHPDPDDDLGGSLNAPDDVFARAFPPHICLDMLATPSLEYHDHHVVIARTLQLCRTDTIRTLHISNTTADALGVLFDHDTLATCPSLEFLAVDFTAEAYYPWYTFHDLSETLSGLQQLVFLSLWCKSYSSIILETYHHSALDMLGDLFYDVSTVLKNLRVAQYCQHDGVRAWYREPEFDSNNGDELMFHGEELIPKSCTLDMAATVENLASERVL